MTETVVDELEGPQGQFGRASQAGQAQQRQGDLRPGQRGRAQRRGHRPLDAAGPDEHEALGALGVLVGELHRDAAAERVADEGGAVDVEHRQEIAHAVGVGGDGVVAAGLVGAAVPEQVGRDDGVVAGEVVEQRRPGRRVVADAVDQQQDRALARHPEGAPVAVHRPVLQGPASPGHVAQHRAG